jgi:hypothetical protein
MIILSRLTGRNERRVAALLAILLAVAPACEASHSCSAIACLEGLSITFDGSFAEGTTYDMVVSVVTATPETVQIATCTLSASDGGAAQLLCGSPEAHTELGNTIRIDDITLSKVIVSVSTGGNTVAEQTFQPAYTSGESGGPGCGTCTSAAIHMTIP